MKHQISCSWTGGMGFEAELPGGKLVMDADEASGGRGAGPRPKPLLLAALAGCTGMDVVSILAKMREPLGWFDMELEAELSEEHPKRYTSFSIVYRFKAAEGLNPENVKKAVELSQEKYCGVSATLKAAGPVSWRIEYL
ncbi:MAG TPA: OsmC family protein [Spirochaetales bacterium]|nr:OsmC family protein [Spirochaetales bacterium]HRY55850.1 OsmC family protein [Spirochaetia bacterium]HRZ65734.1 OsmC family protein [Spirochaetia bacterium]